MIKWCISFLLIFSFSLNLEARKITEEKEGQKKNSRSKKYKRSKKHIKTKKIIGFQPKEKSIEFLLGQPLGFRYQQWQTHKKAMSVDLAYHSDEQILTNLNYAIYYYDAKDKVKRKDFWNSAYFYYGPGLIVGKEVESDSNGNKGEDDFLFGLRAFFGMDYLFINTPYAIRTEAGISKYLSGDDSFGAQLFVGLAYHWDRKRKNFYKKVK